MRIGWDDEHINVIENAKLAEKAGASAIIVHGRTTKQQYMGEANWDIIKAVKEAVNIPVIGNGDIDSPIKAKAMLDYSGVDGIMIGRAAMGNPWIIEQKKDKKIKKQE
uniref:tRNA-dihydrouridine(47) synthase [NAD(P)(+)] n=1 Tax=Ascaris suum TaxID=6253 RepID=F1LHR7_ASCSU